MAYGHGVSTLEVFVDRFMHNAAGGEVGAGFLQSNFQLALPQALISIGFHHHKPQACIARITTLLVVR